MNAQEAEASTYQVKSGDSLWKVAQTHSLSVAKLKELNHLQSDLIFPNQVLRVEGTPQTVPVSNPIVQTPPTQPAQPVSGSTYRVVSGDSLSKIATQFKTTVSALQSANGLSGTLIFVNQTLTIPGGTNAPVSSVTPVVTPPPVSTNAGQSNYTVVSGDSLSRIGLQFKVSVQQLKDWNGLSSDRIFVGQKLLINTSASPAPTTPVTPPSAPTTSEYTVVSGDSLSKIAVQFKTTIANLKALNNLSSDFLSVGQKLKVQGTAIVTTPVANPTAPKPPVVTGTQAQKIVQIAQSFIGVPYVWGGSTPAGFDCSGFIHYVYKQAGISVPRTNSKGMDARSYYLDQPQVGDLVFFANTYTSGISHLGIYIGNNQFIHAGSKGITVTSLNDSYWKKHFDSYKRFYSAD